MEISKNDLGHLESENIDCRSISFDITDIFLPKSVFSL